MRQKNKPKESAIRRYPTPLRYPGGKQRLAKYFRRLIYLNELEGSHYVEPFAGGGGLGLSLLVSGHIKSIHLNDLDRSIYAFWHSVKYKGSELCDLIRSTRLSVAEWDRQREVQSNKQKAKLLDLGFSTFFLNRTNLSGILRGGMIGGREQEGKWSIKSRYDKKRMIDRIQALEKYAPDISISNKNVLMSQSLSFGKRQSCLIYVDPPYFKKSSRLYMNNFDLNDHTTLAKKIRKNRKDKIVITYDTADEIMGLYPDTNRRFFNLAHTAREYRMGKEVMFFSGNLRIPQRLGY